METLWRCKLNHEGFEQEMNRLGKIRETFAASWFHFWSVAGFCSTQNLVTVRRPASVAFGISY
jgi:hypothetical protein